MANFSLHRDFWYYNTKQDKRYCLIFSNWTNVLLSYSISFFDSLEDLKEEERMIIEMYRSVPKPYRHNIGTKWNKKYELVFEEGSFYWGYIILDFETDTINYYHDGCVIPWTKPKYDYKKYVNDCIQINSKSDKLFIKDLFFRKPNEIDPNYKFQTGEYDGWLQFRWGDGKNAIGVYKPEEENKIKKHSNYKPKDKYFKKYEDDDGYLPCTLIEEIAGSNYIDNGGSFDKKETSISIGEILQENMDKNFDKEKSKYLMDKCGW